ncbi:MAG: putative transport protein YhhT [Ignavibacteria bacterium]|nr:putative transport protein YhhT [Ignavibacteria bacterium]
MSNNSLKFVNFTAAVLLIGFFVFILIQLQSILLPFFLAVIISFVFLPLYNFLNSKKIPAAVSMIIIVLLLLVLSNVTSIFIYASINAIVNEFPVYEKKVIEIYDKLIVYFDLSAEEIASINNSLDIKNLLMQGSLTNLITGILTNITTLMGNYILIMFYVIFMITEADSIEKRTELAFTEEKSNLLKETLKHIFEGLKDYISGKTLLSFIQSILIGLFLWIMNVDFYFIWAFLFFLTDFIPNIGSMLATILVALFALLQFDGILTPIIIVIVLIVIQNLKGNVIEPRVMGAKLDLSPLLLFFSLVFWGYVWGVVGMILSVPIMSMLKIILMNIPATKPIAILMSNNPKK